MSDDNLFDEFTPVTAKSWKQKIQVDLKGADYNETLLWDSAEGIRVKPFYNSEDVEAIEEVSEAGPGKFQIGEQIPVENTNQGIERANNALGHGIQSLVLEVKSTDISLGELLSDIRATDGDIFLDLESLSPAQVKSMLPNAKDDERGIYVLNDIFGQLCGSGNWFSNKEKDMEELEGLISEFSHLSPVSVNVSRYQNAGGNRVQQLAYALSHASEYTHLLKEYNVPFITFKASVDTNYFFEIAKLRALRILWARFTDEAGLNTKCKILAMPTLRNKTLYDYNVNMLRTTTESMSAILGGADTVYNIAYDQFYHDENEFAMRIARNQLLILKNESYFDKVQNAASGSYYIEHLTHELIEQAWSLFEQIRSGGGFLTQLKEHKIQKKIKESAKKEQEAFETGKEVLVGSNKYPNENDRMKDQLEKDPFIKMDIRKTLIEPILEQRLAVKLEQSRLKDE